MSPFLLGVPGYTYDGHHNSLHHTGVEPGSQYCDMSIASTSGEGHSTALPVSEWNVTTMPGLQHQEFIMMPSSTAPSVSTDTSVKATRSQEEVSTFCIKAATQQLLATCTAGQSS